MNKIIPNILYAVKKYHNYMICKTLPKSKKTYNYSTGRYIEKPYDMIEIDNKPVSGLHLQSSGGGLTIRDARGFYIPVSISRLKDFIENITIIDGELIGNFRYGWDGNKISIIQCGSEKEKDFQVIKKVERKIPKITKFEIGKEYENCKSEKFIYLGKFSILGISSSGVLKYDNNSLYMSDSSEDVIYGNDLSGNNISIYEFNNFFRKSGRYSTYRLGYCDIFKNEYGNVVIRKGGTKMFIENNIHPTYSNIDLNLKYIRNSIKSNRYEISAEYGKKENIFVFSDNFGFPKTISLYTMEYAFYDTSDPILSNLNPEQYVFCIDKKHVQDKKSLGFYDFSYITRYKDIDNNNEINLFHNKENKNSEFLYVLPAIVWKNKIAITPAGILKV